MLSCAVTDAEFPCTDDAAVQGTGSINESEDVTGKLDLNPILYDNFIGIGDIDNLSLTFFHSDAEQLTILDSVNFETDPDFFEAYFEGTMGPSVVTVEYTFSPVPIPAAAWLFGSALLGLGAIKRRRA